MTWPYSIPRHVLEYDKLCRDRRWLIRRRQGFANIRCNTDEDSPIDPSTLLTAKLSGVFTEGTEFVIVLTSGAGSKLKTCSLRHYRPAYAFLRARWLCLGPSDAVSPVTGTLEVCLHAPRMLAPACMRAQAIPSQWPLFNAPQALFPMHCRPDQGASARCAHGAAREQAARLLGDTV